MRLRGGSALMLLLAAVLPALACAAELTCGIASEIPGFAARDAAGRYQGFEVEFCRAVAAVRYGSPQAVRFVAVETAGAFERDPGIDLVIGGLSASASREADGKLRFGPVYFHDGLHFVVRKDRNLADEAALAGKGICVSGETRAATTLERGFAARDLALEAHHFANDTLAWQAFERGECAAYGADLVEIVKGLAASAHRGDYEVLAARLSDEPLAPVLHAGDAALLEVVRRTMHALIGAERLGTRSGEYDAVDTYGAIYDRTLGPASLFNLPRAGNRAVRDGGLIALPPLE